jgi:hypothetical protein
MMETAIKKINRILDDRHVLIVLAFFIVFLVSGLLLFSDYGVSWDETTQRVWGNEYYDLITRKDPLDDFWQGQYYGPFFQILLAFQEHLFGWQDTREIFLSYHAMTFLFFFIGVVFFYLLSQKIFGKWKISLLACAMLILSPRIFANSFYNPKDIPFLVVMIISMYTLLWVIEKPNYLTTGVHAVASAAAIATRIIGVMVPAFTLAAMILMLLFHRDRKWLNLAGLTLFYLLITCGSTVLFWPILYFEPRVILDSFQYMRNFPWPDMVLYEGQLYHCTELFRSYLPHWIAMTTPIPYTILFLIGVGAILYRLVRTGLGRTWSCLQTNYLLLLYWFFLPFCYVYIMRPCIYTGWRHFYFIYPAMILMAVAAVDALFVGIKDLPNRLKLAARLSLTGILLATFVGVILFIAGNHPYEYLYFNRLAGRSMSEIKQHYDMDYYRVSYRQALEYILAHDPSPQVKIINTSNGLKHNALILKESDRQRLYFWVANETPGYLVTEADEPTGDYSSARLFYAIRMGDTRIVSVYLVTR